MKIGLYTLILVFLSCKQVPRAEDTSLINGMEGSPDMKILDTTAIDLEIYDFAGLKPLLSTSSDDVYIVNFWATWCAPCVKELPYFEEINSVYKDEKVKVLLVSLDFPNKYESRLKPFILKHNLESKVVALNDPDANSWIPQISEEWSGAIPATLIFNKDKRQFYEKSFSFIELETEVKKFLK